jgi:hypothetical protein
MEQRQQGQLVQADFFDNVGGLNLTDSPFYTKDSQSTGGYNYDYSSSGGFKKRDGHARLNGSADAQLKTLGTADHISASGAKTVIRGAGTKIQSFDDSVYTFTNLTEDTLAASSTFLDAASTQPLVFSQFGTPTAKVLWSAGAGQAAGTIYGAYSSTKVTKNGSSPAAGSIGLSVSGVGGTIPTGTYFYAVVMRKASTQAMSNAALDASQAVTLGDNVVIDLTSITAFDTTKYDKFLIYRSSAGGVTGFTAGTLVATINSTSTSYTDTGSVEAVAQLVPRAGNTLLDYSILDATKIYKVLTTFQRRLVTASGSTLYYSDLGLPEAWPVANTVEIPSGGAITGLAIISFSTPTSSDLDEFLVVFKERELWTIVVDTDGNLNLKQVDAVGCPNQALIVAANGYLSWMDYRGIYLWDGSGKPIYCSRPIERFFSRTGDLDKTKLALGWGKFFRKTNLVVWTISHLTLGEQVYQIKMDLRLTLPQVQSSLGGRVLEGVFLQDKLSFPLYAGMTYLPSSTLEESFLAGDGSGYMYMLFSNLSDGVTGSLDFSYETKFLDLGSKSTTKRYHKIIVWTEESTDENLTLDWWTSYKSGEDERATLSVPASTSVSESAWDQAFWDSAYWDSTVRAYSAVVFNLSSPKGSTEGDCIKLRLSQADGNAPINIAGYTIIYSVLGLRK